ncbi:MAG: phosphate signaling complex protein PhoU [Planctomycetota bacterium]
MQEQPHISSDPSAFSPIDTVHTGATPIERELVQLRRRLMRSANTSIDMLEASLHAMWEVDHEIAETVRARDDAIDSEEVGIERECLRLLTLQRPYGQDFRFVMFCLKVNAEIERVADHATSIAKVTLAFDPNDPPRWPTALQELGDRVPVLCHNLLRAVLDEDVDAARRLVEGDSVIDKLDKCLFDELGSRVRTTPDHADDAMRLFRVGRELERVGDLMASIAESVVYLVTGEIIRHQRKTDRGASLPLSG